MEHLDLAIAAQLVADARASRLATAERVANRRSSGRAFRRTWRRRPHNVRP